MSDQRERRYAHINPPHAPAPVPAIQSSPRRGDRLGRHVRNLLECLGLPQKGARLSPECGGPAGSRLR